LRTDNHIKYANKSSNISGPSSVSNCLKTIKDNWKKKSNISSISQNWVNLVGEKLANNCLPLSLNGGVLIIGASHPQWRQAIQYTKIELLESFKRNGHKIKDLKVQQYHLKKSNGKDEGIAKLDKHPSKIDKVGFEICSECLCPAPAGELKRWKKCSFCKRSEF